ncbi:MAG: helix-turn-helix domain-containing protein [Clostridia bacterium]|nr:helix-turn-helix domain-containing protein [Clostridia bacterium]
MSNKFFQGVVYQLKEAFGRPVGVIFDNETIRSFSDMSAIEEILDEVQQQCSEPGRVYVASGYTFIGGGVRGKTDFIAFVEGEDEDAKKDVSILSVSILSIKQFYDEKFDKINFIKNVLLDNIMIGDLHAKTKELHIPTDVTRVVMTVRVDAGHDQAAIDMLANVFPDKEKDFIISIDSGDVAIVKELKPNFSDKDVQKIAKSLLDTINSELMVNASIGIGTIVNDMKDLAKSYREAHVALEVGKVMDTDKPIVSYNKLGIGRLIYQLPTTLCKLFLDEVFVKGSLDTLDHETIVTIQKFFEKNLNVSETSRQLYVHRNTLVYRLDKVQKLTGLDLRMFEDAIVFKVAMMVKKYLESNPNKI